MCLQKGFLLKLKDRSQMTTLKGVAGTKIKEMCCTALLI